MLAVASTLDIGAVLFDILVVLFAAKVAAEVAERIRVPTVLGEIVAGIVVGPSVLGLVDLSDSLTVLAELGVLLLLLGVGMEMDVAELAKVGRASVLVAFTGVAVPFAAGTAAAMALGQPASTAIFIGAALTATSVGITARVFGDLRALGTSEARVVLGAAVVDDVLGLVILTVVAKLATGGAFSLTSVLSTSGLAVGFLALTGIAGRRLVPPLLGTVETRARGTGTLVAVALAMSLGFAALADKAQLAPIIGAFMAGLAMSGSKVAPRVERELAPIGHVFIPAFFLQIGIEADLKAMVSARALELAGVLMVVAVLGKLVSGRVASGAGDRLLIGLGMIPRGEVGLIFAGLGLRAGILDGDLYGALLLVVLLTTVMTPPLLRWRTNATAEVGPVESELSGELLELAIAAARRAGSGEGGGADPAGFELAWLAEHRKVSLTWTVGASTGFVELLRSGGPRSWRLLEGSGVIERALPSAMASIERRRRDISILDPNGALMWPTLERLRDGALATTGDRTFAGRFSALADTDSVMLAAWLLDLAPGHDERMRATDEVLGSLKLPAATEADTRYLVEHVLTLQAAARRHRSLDESHLLELADHIGSVDRLRGLFLLAIADTGPQPGPRAALEHIYQSLMDVLTHPELVGTEAADLAASRLAEALELATDFEMRERLTHAPRSLLLREPATELVRQAQLIEPLPRPGTVRVAVTPDERPDHWRVDVACRDQSGLLARLSSTLNNSNHDVVRASVATWPDGAVLDTFVVVSAERPGARVLGEALEKSLPGPLPEPQYADVEIDFDDHALPWCTTARVTGLDSPGVLAALTGAFARAHVRVDSARISTVGDRIDDLFALTDRRGRKLDTTVQTRIRGFLDGSSRSRRLRRVR